MKAAVLTRYGPPEAVRIAEVEKPSAKVGEVLVKVHATTVNRTDCGFRAAKPFIVRFVAGLIRPRVTILGNEFAGEVEAVGGGVTSFAVGDRVFGYRDNPLGGHAEYIAIREDGMIATIPTWLGYEEAAPILEGSHYALSAIRGANIHSGQTVLVNGATGAIGSAAVQLLRSLGADVTATCGSEHVDLVKGLGAGRVIDYTAEDFTKDEQEYDVVLDLVGKSTFGRCRRLLKAGGIYISSDLGPMGQNPLLALVTPLFRRRKVKFPLPRQNRAMALYFKELVETGKYKPVIDRRYSFDEIVDAHRYVETGQKIGNVVIVVVPSNEQPGVAATPGEATTSDEAADRDLHNDPGLPY